MSKTKKILISSIITFSLAIFGIIGLIITNTQQSPQYARGGAYSTTTQGAVENIDETPQIKYYSYAPNTIKVQQGSDTIKFNYTPSSNLTSTTGVEEYVFPTSSDIDPKYVKNIDARAGQTIAYEYIFGATSEAQSKAVNLGSIGSQEGISISYWWQSTPLQDGEGITNSPAKFTCQEIASNSDIYVYVIVSSESSIIPADFTTNIQWQYGVCKTINIQNNINNSTVSIKTISGQPITQDMLPEVDELNAGEGYQINNYYTDESMTQLINVNNPFYVEGDIYIKLFKPLPASCFTYRNGEYILTDGSTLSGEITIPSTFDDGVNGEAPVTQIEDDACRGCNITRLILSEGITTVGEFAFQYSSLLSVILPSTLTKIDEEAFNGCYSLAEVYNLSSLQITLASTPSYGRVGNYALVIHTDISTPSRIIIKDGVAYYKESDTSYIAIGLIDINKTSITLDSRTTSINQQAFSSCSSLTSITIPNSVTSIESNAFNYCYALAEVYNLSSLTFTIGAGTSDNGGIAQYAKVIHTDSSTPTRITTINGVAYYKESDSSYIALVCTDKTKTSVTLDSRTTGIGMNAFYNRSALTNITIPDGVTSIGRRAFYGCDSLTSLDLSNCTNLTSIGDNAFYQCSSLTSITIPSSVTSIGGYVFYGCNKLTSITFSDTSTWYRTSSSTNWANKTGGTKTDVSNPTRNATEFGSSYYWYKK